jgi:hypothetical protein
MDLTLVNPLVLKKAWRHPSQSFLDSYSPIAMMSGSSVSMSFSHGSSWKFKSLAGSTSHEFQVVTKILSFLLLNQTFGTSD